MGTSENQSHTSFSCVLSSCNEQPGQLTAGDVGESNALTGNSECSPKEKGSAPGSDSQFMQLVFDCSDSCKQLPPHRRNNQVWNTTGQAESLKLSGLAPFHPFPGLGEQFLCTQMIRSSILMISQHFTAPKWPFIRNCNNRKALISLFQILLQEVSEKNKGFSL